MQPCISIQQEENNLFNATPLNWEKGMPMYLYLSRRMSVSGTQYGDAYKIQNFSARLYFAFGEDGKREK